MNSGIVSFEKLAACRGHILAPRHYLPVHRVEECEPSVKQQVRMFTISRRLQLDAEIKAAIALCEKDIEAFIETERGKYGVVQGDADVHRPSR
jgi:hypothetical protein